MPPQSDLPAVARAAPAAPSAPEPASASGGAEGGRATASRGLRWAGVAVAAALGVIAALGVAALLGDELRRAALIEVRVDPAGSTPAYSDAPREAATFFADRDTVGITVARDMTVADFLALYHLENNQAARDALRDQLGAAEDSDLLREGDRVTVPLTLRREGG